MLRRCNGKDPNLLVLIERTCTCDVCIRCGCNDYTRHHRTEYKPCNCGLVFDDVHRLTIYPHEKF